MTVINGLALLANPPIIDMFNHKRTSQNGVSHGLAEVGYDIRIKQDVLFTRTGPRQVMTCSLTSDDECTGLTIGRFLLASAIEEFDMPNNLVGIVHDKSTWARKGLSVFNTVIEPGWKGFLTLELVYHGQGDLHIPAGSGIAQVVFHRLAQPSSYVGSYQNQKDEPVSSILDTR